MKSPEDTPPENPKQTPPPAQARRKRERARVACLECKRSKQKCDNERPCARCISKGKAAECCDSEQILNVPEKKKVNVYSKYMVETSQSVYLNALMNFSELFDKQVESLSPKEIHDTIVNTPLRWVGFLGHITRHVNQEYCLQLRCRMASKALTVADDETKDIVADMCPLKSIQFQQFEFVSPDVCRCDLSNLV